MEKKMTALEILIEDLRATHTAIPTNTKENRRVKGTYVDAIQKARALLPTEMKIIGDAFYSGSCTLVDTESFADYFTQTYGKG